MVREGYRIRPKALDEMTPEERRELQDLPAKLRAFRERIRRQTGNIDVTAVLRRARGVDE
jgi:hypothetical protein